MTETRPRQFASLLLKDIRPYVVEWFEKNGVPKEHQRMVMTHVINAAFKARYGKQPK